MALKIKFTDAVLRNIAPPDKGNVTYTDCNPKRAITGLKLLVSHTGNKSFILKRKINGKTKSVTIGKHPDYSVEKARRKAQELIPKLTEGFDPTEEKKTHRARNVTLEQCFKDYMEDRSLTNNTSSNYNTLLNNQLFNWKQKPLANISREMIQKKHRNLSEHSKSSANKAMRLVRALFNFASEEYLDNSGCSIYPDNPVKQLKHKKLWNKETRKKTPLKGKELSVWYKSLINLRGEGLVDTTRDLLIFILFTGLRRREASNLKWENVDLNNKYFFIPEPKNHNPLYLPLTNMTHTLLTQRKSRSNSDYVFSGAKENAPIQEPKRQIHKLKESSGTNFTIHALRGTYITIASSTIDNSYIVKALVNHKLPTGDVTAGYISPDVETLRKPAQLIEVSILEIINI